MNRDCPNARCRTGGLDRSQVKLGARNLADALRGAQTVSARRVTQGHPPVVAVYMCAAGYWHHSSKAPASTSVATLGGFTIGRDANVAPATVAMTVMAYRTSDSNEVRISTTRRTINV